MQAKGPRVVCMTGGKPFSKKVTVEEFNWSIGTMWCFSILLINHSIHVHSLLRFSDVINFLISSMYHSGFTLPDVHQHPWTLKQYSLIIPLQPNAHLKVTFSTLGEWYWCSESKSAYSVCSSDQQVEIHRVTEKLNLWNQHGHWFAA